MHIYKRPTMEASTFFLLRSFLSATQNISPIHQTTWYRLNLQFFRAHFRGPRNTRRALARVQEMSNAIRGLRPWKKARPANICEARFRVLLRWSAPAFAVMPSCRVGIKAVRRLTLCAPRGTYLSPELQIHRYIRGPMGTLPKLPYVISIVSPRTRWHKFAYFKCLKNYR